MCCSDRFVVVVFVVCLLYSGCFPEFARAIRIELHQVLHVYTVYVSKMSSCFLSLSLSICVLLPFLYALCRIIVVVYIYFVCFDIIFDFI